MRVVVAVSIAIDDAFSDNGVEELRSMMACATSGMLDV